MKYYVDKNVSLLLCLELDLCLWLVVGVMVKINFLFT